MAPLRPLGRRVVAAAARAVGPATPRAAALAVGVVVAAACAVHARTVTFDFVDLDDRDLVVDDLRFLASPAAFAGAFTRSYMHALDPSHPYYRPLVTLSFALDARRAGAHAGGFHLTNLALHLVASALFFALLGRFSLGRAVTCAAAAAFAVHPAVASAVAWIPGRNDSLLAVLSLAAWLAFAHDCDRPSWRARSLHVASFWLALLAKETALVIPLVCAAHLVLTRGPTRPRGVVVAGWVAGVAARLSVHAHPPVDAGSALRGAALLPVSLGQVLLPFNPCLLGDRADVSPWPGLALAVLVAVAARAVPGVRPRVLGLGAAAFVLFVAPAAAAPGTRVLGSRLYLPACGALLVAAEIARAAVRERHARVAVSVASVAVLAALTVAYETTFRDRRAFARAAVAASPHAALAHVCLAKTLQLDGDRDRALSEYRLALALGASYVVHNNIAVIHMAEGRWADAERELYAELGVDPGSARAYRNLAIVLRREDRPAEARAAEARAAELGAAP